MRIRFHGKCPLFLSDCNYTSIFSRSSEKILKYQISYQYVQWPYGRADGPTDVTQLKVAYPNFAKALKIEFSGDGGLLMEGTLPAAKLNWCLMN